MVLEEAGSAGWHEVRRGVVSVRPGATAACVPLESGADLRDLRWRLATDLPAGTYRLRVDFCQRKWEDMPASVASYPFAVGPPTAAECAPASQPIGAPTSRGSK